MINQKVISFAKSLPLKIVFSDSEYLNETLLQGVRPSSHHWKRVTQLAAIKIDNGMIVDTFCEYVLPRGEYTDEMWKAHENITHLKQKDVCGGQLFPYVYARFLEFCGAYPIMVMLGDHDVHKKDMKEYGLDIDTSHYMRLKPTLVDLQKDLFEKTVSGELYKLVGLTEKDVQSSINEINGGVHEIGTHNALFDSASMALFVLNVAQNQ